jgi:hypothetical protein
MGVKRSGKELEGSFSDKNRARDSLRADFRRIYPPGLSRNGWE